MRLNFLSVGFPVSYTAPSDALSHQWRTNFIATFLNRDIREFGVTVPAQTLHRICALAPPGASVGIYRTAAGAELDVVVQWGSKKLGFEIKFSSAPKVSKGFWHACQDVGVQHAYVVAPVPNWLGHFAHLDPPAAFQALPSGPASVLKGAQSAAPDPTPW